MSMLYPTPLGLEAPRENSTRKGGTVGTRHAVGIYKRENISTSTSPLDQGEIVWMAAPYDQSTTWNPTLISLPIKVGRLRILSYKTVAPPRLRRSSRGVGRHPHPCAHIRNPPGQRSTHQHSTTLSGDLCFSTCQVAFALTAFRPRNDISDGRREMLVAAGNLREDAVFSHISTAS
jgi:hypothetical protein